MVYHDEPIYRDGERVGALTSASWGHTLGAAVGMGYVHADDGVTREWLEAGTFEIDVAGERMPAMAQLEAFYDPKGERMKG